MQETTADIQRDIEETRMRVTQTLAELSGEVNGRRDAAKAKVAGARESIASAGSKAQSAVTDLAREHPWYAIGAAVAVGMLIGRSGADRAVASGVTGGAGAAAKGVAGAAAGAAKTTAAKVKGLVSSAEDTGPGDQVADAGGLFYRLQTGLVEAVGGNDLLAEMRREAGNISGDRGGWPAAEQSLK